MTGGMSFHDGRAAGIAPSRGVLRRAGTRLRSIFSSNFPSRSSLSLLQHDALKLHLKSSRATPRFVNVKGAGRRTEDKICSFQITNM